jgi:hypothetical protein
VDDAPTAASLAGSPTAAALGLTSHAALVAFTETAASSAFASAVRVGDWQLASLTARLLLAVYRLLAAAMPGADRSGSTRGFRRGGSFVAWNDWGWWERAPPSSPGMQADTDDGPALSLTKAASAVAAAAAAAQPPQAPAALQLQTRAGITAVAVQLANEVLAAAARASSPRQSRRDDTDADDYDAAPTGPVTMPLPPYVTDCVSRLDGGVLASLQAGGNGDDGAGDAGAALRTAAALCCAGIVAPQPHAPAFALVGARGAVPGFGSATGGDAWAWAVLKLPPGATVADAVGSLRTAFAAAGNSGGIDVPVHGPEVPVLASERRAVTVTHVLQAVDPAAAGLPPGLPAHFAGAFGSSRYGGLSAGPRYALVPVEAASSQWSLLGAGSTAAAALAAAEGGSTPVPTAVPPAVHVWPLLEVPDGDDLSAAPPHGFTVGASGRHLPPRPHGAARLRAWAVRSATAVTEVVTEPAAAGGHTTVSAGTTTTARRSLTQHAVSALGAPLLLGGKYELRTHGNPDKLLRDDGSGSGGNRNGGEDGDASAGAGAEPESASPNSDEQLAELLQRQQDAGDGDGVGDGANAQMTLAGGAGTKQARKSSSPSVSSSSPLLMLDVLLPAAVLAGDAPGASDADEGAATWGLPQPSAGRRIVGGGSGVIAPLPLSDVWATRIVPLPAAATVTIAPAPLAAGLTQVLRLSASAAVGGLRTLLGATWVVDGLPPVALPPPVSGSSYYHYHHQRAPVRPSAEDDASLLLGGPALRFDAGGPIPPPPSTIQPAGDAGGYGNGSAARDLDAVQLAPLTVGDAYPLALLLGLQTVDGAVESLPAASLLPGVATKSSAGGANNGGGAAAADVPPLEHDATAACGRLAQAASAALGLAPGGGSDGNRTVVPLDDPASVALVYALAAASAPAGGGPAASAPVAPSPLLVSAVTSPGPLLTPASAAALLAALTPSPASWLPLLCSARVLLTDYAELKAMWREKRVTQLRRAWIREDEALAAAGYDTSDREVPDFAALLPRKPHRAALALDAAVCGGLTAAGALAAAVESVPRADGGSGAGRARAVGAFNAAFDGTTM